MSKNYYDEKIKDIENLIESKKYKEAQKEINNELNVPYVPKIYEDVFNSMLEQILDKLETNEKTQTISKAVALDYLISNDEQKEVIAIELLRDHNLHFDKEIIKTRIETWNFDKNLLKAYLFEILVEQNIDIDINFNGLNLNPLKNGSILDKKEVQSTLKTIEKIFTKNPSWRKMATDEFHKFLLLNYPFVPEKPEETAHDICKIINSYFDDNLELTAKQKKIKTILSK